MNLTLIQLREEQVEAHSAFTKATEAIKAAEPGADLDKRRKSSARRSRASSSSCRSAHATPKSTSASRPRRSRSACR